MEIERRREVEERYADAQDGPGAVATGGGDWKEADQTQRTLKRGRSPDDDGDAARVVRFCLYSCLLADPIFKAPSRTRMEDDEADRM